MPGRNGVNTAIMLRNTKHCWKKLKEHSAKSADLADKENSFAFKVTVETNSEMEQKYRMNCLLVDTGATTHIINDKTKFVSFEKNYGGGKHLIELADGSRMNNLAEGPGNANIDVTYSKGIVREAVLENALYVSSFKQNIFSIHCATNSGQL